MLEGALRRGKPPDHVLLSGPPGPGQDHDRHDHRRGARARRCGSPAGPPSSGPGTWPRCCPRWPRARWCSSTRSTGSPGRPRRCSTWRWRTSGSTSWSARGPGATAIPLDIAPFTLVGRHDQGRPAARAAARQVRLHRPPGLLRGRRAGRHHPPVGRAARGRAARRRRRRDRRALARHAQDRQPAAAAGPRLRRGPRRRGGDQGGRASRAGAVRGGRERPGPARPRRARPRWCAGSAAARSACRRSRSRSARRRRRSRWWPSRSWSGRA